MPANLGLSSHCWVAAISFSNDLMTALLASGTKVKVLSDPRSVALEGLDVRLDAALGGGQVEVIEVEVQEVDVPREFDAIADIGRDDFPRDGQRGGLRVVVDV